MRSSGSTSSRTNASAQSKSSWYSASVSKSHMWPPCPSGDVSVDERADVGGDDVGERPVAEGARGPVPGTLADERPREVGQVRDVDLGSELAVGLGAGEELGEHVRVDVGRSALREDGVLVPIPLQDGFDDEFARVAGHRLLERRQRSEDYRIDFVRFGEQGVDGAVRRLR